MEDKVFVILEGCEEMIRGITSTRELAEKIINMFPHLGLKIQEHEVID